MEILRVENLCKEYGKGQTKVKALDNVSFSVEKGEYLAIMGESGSGKTTLLNILASLDKPTSGTVFLNEVNTTKISEKDISKFRRDNLGFVFQDFNLLDTFSVRDNIYLPLVLQGKDYREMESRMMPIVKRLEITDILDKFPYEISGGQKQRTAAARALITSPQLVLADEPTGALDSRASEHILKMFEEINQEGQTIVMVTHSAKAASHASRILFIKDGVVYHQLYRASLQEDDFYQSIQSTLTVISRSGELNA